MSKTVYAPGREAILDVILNGEKSNPDPFAASLFGRIYEKLLEYYFRQQRVAGSDYGVWRFVGKPSVKPYGANRKIPVDFLVEDVTRPGSSPPTSSRRMTGTPTGGGHHLVCFEAKSWPAFQDFCTLNSKNVARFLEYNGRFLQYIECLEWYAKLDSGKTIEIMPDAYGFLVFDYAHDERSAILSTFNEWNPKLQEIESIADLLSMVIYNKSRLDASLASDLEKMRHSASNLFSLFL